MGEGSKKKRGGRRKGVEGKEEERVRGRVM